MFSLQQLLGQNDKFFDLLEASALEARTSVEALVKLIANPNQTTLSFEFVLSRRKEKELREKISEAVYNTFVTALEREDIECLANALYRIPKTVEKFANRLLLTPQHIQAVEFAKQRSVMKPDPTAAPLFNIFYKGRFCLIGPHVGGIIKLHKDLVL